MKERKIRLFISSTFKDMNEERDYLINFIFPQIKDYCHSRYINFIPIDLRWGVTEEESRNGMVLASCMEEVDNSRPFFVGILGHRYGWMPTESELTSSRPSVSQNIDYLKSKIRESASITEIEMDYAVFRDKTNPHASFFIKSDNVNLPKDFYEEKDSLAEQKLHQLKQRIIEQKDYPVYTYFSTKELGDLLLKEVIAMIQQEFPEERNDYNSSIISRHEAALERHAFSLFEIPNIKENMNHWGKNGYGPLLITGPSGSGTSNNLAVTTKHMRYQHTDKRIIYYDFECSDPTKDLMDDFLDYLRLEENQIPKDDWSMLAIDNASLLDMDQTEKILEWKNSAHENLHFIFAASSSSFADTMLMHHCDTITQHGLTHEMQFVFIDNFTSQYGKHLTKKQQEKIVRGEHSNDPTILTLLLNELINFGSYENLDYRIEELVNHSKFSIFYG